MMSRQPRRRIHIRSEVLDMATIGDIDHLFPGANAPQQFVEKVQRPPHDGACFYQNKRVGYPESEPEVECCHQQTQNLIGIHAHTGINCGS